MIPYHNYEISSHGNIRNKKTKRIKKLQHVKRNGYTTVQTTIKTNGKLKTITVSRAVCIAFHGLKKDKHAAHKDGDSTNNKSNNIYWATPKENINDQFKHGTFATIKNGNKPEKITIEIIKECLNHRKNNMSWRQIEKIMGFSNSSLRSGIKRHGY